VKRSAVILLVGASLAAGCSKPDASALFAKGNEYVEAKQFAEAILQYQLAVQADPKRGDVRVKLSEAYLQQRDYRSALREAIVAADLLPGDIKAQIEAGNILLVARAWEDANSRAEKALALDAKNPDALVLKGNAQAGLNKFDDALAEYQEALALNPQSDQIYASIGSIQVARGQFKEAQATFRKAVEIAPRSVPARIALASFLWSSGHQAEAETEFTVALSLDPSNLVANRALGGFYMATGRSADAERYFKALAAAVNTDTAQMALADYYLAVRRPDEARAILTPLSQKSESFGPASLRLAAIEMGRNNPGVATTIVRSVLEKTPRYIPARVFELRLLVLDSRLDDAMVAANALMEDEPNSPAAAEANFVVGGIEASRDRIEEARKAYEGALRLQPQSLPIVLALAQLSLRVGNADQAERYARQVLAGQPGNAAARAVIVRAYLLRNDPAKAAAELAGLEKAAPNAVPVQILVAAGELTAGKTEAARATYMRVLSMAPNDLEALQGLITIDMQAGRQKDAVDRAEAALKRMPPTAELSALAARAHATAGNLTRAEELLKQSIEREPARLAAYDLLGQLYLSQKRLSDARDQFQEIVKRNPRSVAAHTMLGMVLEAQKDLPAAEAQYQKALTIDPTAAVAANNLAWIFMTSKRNLREALQLAQAAQTRMPDEPHVNATLGWAYYLHGRYAQAVRSLELSLKRASGDPVVHYHLGMAYVQAGDVDKGKASLQKALSMSPSFEGADEARKTLAGLGG
jgi:tetratricopeptide (TPR) repeat protein